MSVASAHFLLFCSAERERMYSLAWLSFGVFTHDTIFHPPLSVLFSLLSELFWRTVCTMGFCQEGWEPHEEPIWEYYCMCVQSTSSTLMNFCSHSSAWFIGQACDWMTISCSNRLLLPANESSLDLSDLLLYSSSFTVFTVKSYKPMQDMAHEAYTVFEKEMLILRLIAIRVQFNPL